jgi:hypothetical protein
MPAEFPSVAHNSVMAHVAPRSDWQNEEFLEFSTAWLGVVYRYLGATEHDREFTESIRQDGVAPQPPARFTQEHALFAFFASGLATIECFTYAAHAIGWLLEPDAFDLSTDQAKRGATPVSTCEAFERMFAGDAIPVVLRAVIDSDEYDKWRRTRHLLSHRAAPGRQFAINPPGDEAVRSAAWLGLWIDEHTTANRLAWLSETTTSLIEAADDFARAHFEPPG